MVSLYKLSFVILLIGLSQACPCNDPMQGRRLKKVPKKKLDAAHKSKMQSFSAHAPNIGVFTQPAKGNYRKFGYKSMIPASYAEWIEQIGANIVPIPYTLEKDEIDGLLRQLNGLILPGGGTAVFGKSFYEFYRQRVYHALNIAKKINEEGMHFPVWGTCMGFEQIINWASGYTIWPTKVANYHIDRRIHWDYDVLSKTIFAEHLDEKMLEDIQSHPISYFNHKWGISRRDFQANAHLREVLMPVSDTYSIEGEDFLSSVEGKKLPIIGTQYHPEKVQFEHTKANEGMNIGDLAISAAVKLGEAFVNEAKKNKHTFKCEKLLQKLLIQNFKNVYTDSTFESIYFFNEAELNYADVMLDKDGC